MRQLFSALLGLSLLSTPAHSADKEIDCQFQADLMGAVQQARLDRVRKGRVAEDILAAHPDWPVGAADALPPLVEYVWGIKRRDLKAMDLAAQTQATCLENYEAIQALRKSLDE